MHSALSYIQEQFYTFLGYSLVKDVYTIQFQVNVASFWINIELELVVVRVKCRPCNRVFHDKYICRKTDKRSARQKNSGKMNLLKSCLQWDLISQQQPSLL